MTLLPRTGCICLLLIASAACDTSKSMPPSSESGIGEIAVADTSASVLELASYPQLTALLTPLRSAILNAGVELQPDSGTLTADSVFLRLRRDLETEISLVAPQFNDREFQADVWPSGAAAMARWREQERSDQSAAQEELARADSLTALLKAHGIWAEQSEGDTYLSLNLSLLLTRAGPYVTTGMRDFLAIEAEEQRRPTANDAALTITLEQLEQRIRWTEQFVKAYPEALLINDARDKFFNYMTFYLDGLDNTPAFDRETGQLRPQLQDHMAQYVRKHARMTSAHFVSRYLEILKQSDYRRTAESDALVAELHRSTITRAGQL